VQVKQHSYGCFAACILRVVNQHPKLPAFMPSIAYLVLSAASFLIYAWNKIDESETMVDEMVLFGTGICTWAGILSLGAQMKVMRVKHQLPVVPMLPCSTSWIAWLVGLGTAYGLWLMLFTVCFVVDSCKDNSESIFLALAVASMYGSVTIAVYDASAIQASAAMLSVRVGWLLHKLDRSEEALEQFQSAHARLLNLLGENSVGAYVAAPGNVATLKALGHVAEANELAARVLDFVDGNLTPTKRCLFALFNEEGSANWLQCIKALPVTTNDKLLADAGYSSVPARWKWLRAELFAAQGKPAAEIMAALREAIATGCCFSARADPVFASLFSLHDAAGRASATSQMAFADSLNPIEIDARAPMTDILREQAFFENMAESDGLTELEALEAEAVKRRKRAGVWFVFRLVGGTAILAGLIMLVVWVNWLQ
jgi:hypothetical protein